MAKRSIYPQSLHNGLLAAQIAFSDNSSGIYATEVGTAGNTPEVGFDRTSLACENQRFHFTFRGVPGKRYEIQQSNTLPFAQGTFTSFATFTYSTPIAFIDENANSAARFHRAVELP